MFDPIESDAIYGPLDESEEAVAAANELAEKNDDPDMQVMKINFQFFINKTNKYLDVRKCSCRINR